MKTPKSVPIDLDALKAAEKRFWNMTREYTEPQKPKPFERDHQRGGLSYKEAMDRWVDADKEGTIQRCLFWTGYLTKDGTGQFSFKNKKYPAHRIAYMLAYGHIPEGKKVIRTCGHLRCVEPEHLKLVDKRGLTEVQHEGREKRRGKPPRSKRKKVEPAKWEDCCDLPEKEFDRLLDLVLGQAFDTLTTDVLEDFSSCAFMWSVLAFSGRRLTHPERARWVRMFDAERLAQDEIRKRKAAAELTPKKERGRAAKEEPDRLSAEVVANLTREQFRELTRIAELFTLSNEELDRLDSEAGDRCSRGVDEARTKRTKKARDTRDFYSEVVQRIRSEKATRLVPEWVGDDVERQKRAAVTREILDEMEMIYAKYPEDIETARGEIDNLIRRRGPESDIPWWGTEKNRQGWEELQGRFKMSLDPKKRDFD